MTVHPSKSVFVTGASGFIGRRVVRQLSDHGYRVTALSRGGHSNVPGGISTVSQVGDCRSADFIIHIAHDPYSQSANRRLWRELEALAERSGARGIVAFSTVSVHDPDFRGVLTEADPFAEFGDDYVTGKIWLEQAVLAWAERSPGVSAWILRPTIVVGEGGNWTSHGLDVAAKSVVRLPLEGQNPCCAVHVHDVARATLCALASLADFAGVRASLVSGPHAITWRDFYHIHGELLQERTGRAPDYQLSPLATARRFHDSLPKDLLYRMLFNSPLSGVLRLGLGKARELIRLRRAWQPEAEAGGSEVSGGEWSPAGMSRIVHSSQFVATANLPDWTAEIEVDIASLVRDEA